jgi:hypothetical protein
MGEIADMMLDGTLCAGCGEFLGEDAGYPVYCLRCAKDLPGDNFQSPKYKPRQQTAPKVKCDVCGKKVKASGLADHKRDTHGGPDEQQTKTHG